MEGIKIEFASRLHIIFEAAVAFNLMKTLILKIWGLEA